MAKHKPYRYVLYVLLRLLCFIVQLMPRKVNLAVAHGLGYSIYWLLKKERMKTLNNLKQAFGAEKTEAECVRIGQNVFINLAKSFIDVLYFPKLNRTRIEQLVLNDTKNSYLDEGLSAGCGVLALTGHIGSWELLASYFRFMGYPGVLMGRRIYYEPFNQILVSLRRSALVETIYRDESPRKVLAELKANHVVGISADQDIDSLEGIFVPFFGTPSWTPIGPAKLAATTGAAIVPAFMLHEGDQYRLHLEKPIVPRKDVSKEEAVGLMTEEWAKVVESYIRRYPEQWVWMHNRWKTKADRVAKKNSELARAAS